jgi:hypothetical protein
MDEGFLVILAAHTLLGGEHGELVRFIFCTESDSAGKESL